MSKPPLLQRLNEEDRAIIKDMIAMAIAEDREQERKHADYYGHVLGKAFQIAADNDEADYDTNNLYDFIREGVKAKKDLVNERERCAGVLRNYIRYATEPGTTRDSCITLMRGALSGMNPEEGKISLTVEQELKDLEAQIRMEERERCARIADEYCCGVPDGEEIARLIRSGE